LDCGGLKVSDLSPLKGMKLDTLGLSGTPVSNLSPLEGMPLSRLCLDYARVSDLSPLQGMPLNRLDCNDTPVSDLSPVGEMHLTLLNFTPKNITKGLDVIRQMKTLKTIGTSCEGKDQFPSAEFWKKYDAGEFNK
jgi:Leucine-rich repeat (LRR) protein